MKSPLINHYDNFCSQLQDCLGREKLPGMEAHLKMAPPQRFANRAYYQPDEKTRHSAVLLLIYPKEDKLYFPLIVRPENSGVHSGQVALPGGKKEDDDPDYIATALRETSEEIGVEVPRECVLGQLSSLYIPPSNFLVHPTIAALPHTPEFVPDQREVAQLLHIDLQDFQEKDCRREGLVSAKYLKAKVPYYDIADKIVWGATAMILSEFLIVSPKTKLH